MFIIAPCLYVPLSCFKQSPSNFTLILWPMYDNFGVALIPDILKDLISSSHNPLDFHEEILLLRAPVVFKIIFNWLKY